MRASLRSSLSVLLTTAAPLPAAWRAAHIILLPKPGSRSDLGSYRPISLLQVLYKLYTGIITTRLSKLAAKHIHSPGQFGFRKGMSTQSALRALANAFEDARTRNRHTLTAARPLTP
jgi:hypothetical protein